MRSAVSGGRWQAGLATGLVALARYRRPDAPAASAGALGLARA